MQLIKSYLRPESANSKKLFTLLREFGVKIPTYPDYEILLKDANAFYRQEMKRLHSMGISDSAEIYYLTNAWNRIESIINRKLNPQNKSLKEKFKLEKKCPICGDVFVITEKWRAKKAKSCGRGCGAVHRKRTLASRIKHGFYDIKIVPKLIGLAKA